MIRSPRHQHNSGKLWKTLGVLGIVLVALFFLPLPGFLKDGAHTVGAPLLRAEYRIRNILAPLNNYALTKKYLSDEISRLERERDALVRAGLLAAYLRAENEELKMALMRTPEQGSRIFAAILAGPIRSPYDTFVLDAGSDVGVQEGGMVLTPHGYALGTITSVNKKSSVATLFSSPNVETRIMLGTSSPNALRAIGHGAGSFEIHVPREVSIGIGDAVLLPGAAILPLGAVEEIAVNETSAYQSVLFGYPHSIFSMRYVIISDPPAYPHRWEADAAEIEPQTP